MKKKPTQYPPLIQNLLGRIETFVLSHCLYGRPNIWRSMRTERQKSCVILLSVLAKSCALALDGRFVRVVNGVAYPLTVLQMSKLSGLSRWCVERTLADLRQLGFIENCQKQVLRHGLDGLECLAVMRKFTNAFWLAIGLWPQFVESVKFAAAHSKLRISWSFHKIADKTKKLISMALAGSAPAKVPKDRDRLRRITAFQEFVFCSAKHGADCLGSYASDDACAICRRMRTIKR